MAEKFVDACRKYCSWIERASIPPNQEGKILEMLASLLFFGLQLPEGQSPDMDSDCRPGSDELKSVYERLVTVRPGFYSETLDPTQQPTAEVGTGDIHDDLRDIYADLKEGLNLFDAGRREEAVWAWKFGLRHHWGTHAASAVRVLQRLAFG